MSANAENFQIHFLDGLERWIWDGAAGVDQAGTGLQCWWQFAAQPPPAKPPVAHLQVVLKTAPSLESAQDWFKASPCCRKGVLDMGYAIMVLAGQQTERASSELDDSSPLATFCLHAVPQTQGAAQGGLDIFC
ncbi:hypothetical protein SRHO_G00241710 [Serrasalmus rhombeus]